MSKAQGGKGSRRKIGRNKAKCGYYQNDKTREKNKLKRILASNGPDEANKYAAKYTLESWLHRLPAYIHTNDKRNSSKEPAASHGTGG